MNSRVETADIHESPRQDPRLPPGQVRTEKWPVLHYGSVPRVDIATREFRVFGEVERPGRWTWEEFQRLPRPAVRSDIHCVTRWSRFDNLWGGGSRRTVLDAAGRKPPP